MKQLLALTATVFTPCCSGAIQAVDAPTEIKIGTLYASTGASTACVMRIFR